MSVHAALQFIQQTRRDAALRQQLQDLGQADSLDPVVRLGADRGWAFSGEELQAAFKQDWGLQWARSRGRLP
jgi:predicted ribosomally synthesized peptide with nif11-like leader